MLTPISAIAFFPINLWKLFIVRVLLFGRSLLYSNSLSIVSGEKVMAIRVVRSSQGKVKIPYIADIEPGEASNGYVTNVEGLLKRVQQQVEVIRNSAEDKSDQKKAKNILKKINKIMWGDEKTKITIEDPSGNSAILSDKAETSRLKVKKWCFNILVSIELT